jgi:hypothetical protein
MENSLNISRAAKVSITINNYDQIPLSLTYSDNSNPGSPTPIDIRTYAFSFDLKAANSDVVMKNYALPAGGPSTDYLAVTGTDHNILSMAGMWNDIKVEVPYSGQYRLIQLVTDNNGNQFVHIIYTILVQRD